MSSLRPSCERARKPPTWLEQNRTQKALKKKSRLLLNSQNKKKSSLKLFKKKLPQKSCLEDARHSLSEAQLQAQNFKEESQRALKELKAALDSERDIAAKLTAVEAQSTFERDQKIFAQNDIQKLKKKLEDREQDLVKIEEQLGKAYEDSQKAWSTVTQRSDELDAQRNKVEQYSTALAQKTELLENISTEVLELQRLEQEKSQSLREAESEMESMQQNMERFRKQITEKSTEAERWKKEAAAARDLARQAQKAAEDSIAIASQVEQLHELVEQQQRQIQGKDEEREQMQQAYDSIQLEHQQLQGVVEKLRKEEQEQQQMTDAHQAAQQPVLHAQYLPLELDGLSAQDIMKLRDQAAEEAKVAADLLSKAEVLAQQLRGQMVSSLNSTQELLKLQQVPEEDLDELDFKQQVAVLKKELLEQQEIANASIAQADELSEELQFTQDELVSLRETVEMLRQSESAPLADENQSKLSLDKDFMEQLVTAQTAANAANAAAEELRQQVRMLQSELQEQEKSRLDSLPKAAPRDKVLRAAMSRVKDLENENRILRVDLQKKQQVLAQSKNFIKQYLEQVQYSNRSLETTRTTAAQLQDQDDEPQPETHTSSNSVSDSPQLAL
eukprot:TRINITY_DN5044_c0_g1_i1.p2 TRINITY_DN5044_c0_g1~~TRINITY_DN5044_c0_g1_i1.p2  ORF type:complete len:616 (+),score=124.95 TRINITY_DN5044_c0_g1_i1:1712-3559(+)